MSSIDLNSDVGEGVNNEAALMPLISSCNIACGGHAGSVEIMKEVTALAIKNNVKIGAHPGYEDKANFGRVPLDISRKQLQESIQTQILQLKEITAAQGASLHHIKPHGALYNKAAVDKETAAVIIETIKAIDDALILYVPYHSVILEMAQGVLPVKIEGFADRNYNRDYTLVSRSKSDALITEPAAVMRHINHMINGQLYCVSGEIQPIQVGTICVHGDTKSALEILSYIHKNAKQHQIEIV